jgi:hypothetical protein
MAAVARYLAPCTSRGLRGADVWTILDVFGIENSSGGTFFRCLVSPCLLVLLPAARVFSTGWVFVGPARVVSCFRRLVLKGLYCCWVAQVVLRDVWCSSGCNSPGWAGLLMHAWRCGRWQQAACFPGYCTLRVPPLQPSSVHSVVVHCWRYRGHCRAILGSRTYVRASIIDFFP